MIKASFWQSITMGVVVVSFIAANMGWQPAVNLWSEGAESIAVFLGGGVGFKMLKDYGIDRNQQRGKGSQNVDTGA